MAKIIENVLKILCAALLLWIVISFVDVNLHNLSDYHYLSWNFFTWFVKLA